MRQPSAIAWPGVDRSPESAHTWWHSQVPRQAMQDQRGGDGPGLDRDIPGGAPVRVEAGLRGLAVLLGAGGEGGRADRAAADVDEVRSGPAAAQAEGASEAPGQLARVRRAG